MADWSETCRSTVAPWECDVTEHFTIAFYLDRVEMAGANLADRLGVAETLRIGGFVRRFDLRFVHELRAGDSFHVESAPLGLDPDLRLGHRIVDSAGGETVTWVEESWELPSARLPAARREGIGRQLAKWDVARWDVARWDGPAIERRPAPKSMAGAIPSARGRAKPGDLDENSRFSLAAFVHRFTDGLLQTLAAIGMGGASMKTARRGFSTFELALRISSAPIPGTPYLVETGIAHLGNSSIRFVHRMTDPRSRAEFARADQFGVQLDLDTRRPAPLPEAVRARAAALLLPTG
ncbi:MAG: thioesterase family protein [Stellaceae bacterium]